MNPQPPRKAPVSFLRQFALAMDLPFVLVGAVAIGGGLGYLLDRWLHTGPLLLILLGAAGFAGGIWEVLRILSQGQKGNGKSDGG